MLGTIVNTACIVVGTLLGTIFKKGLGEKYTNALFNILGVVCIALGVSTFTQNISKSEFPVLFILSLAIGGIIGTALDLDGRSKRYLAKKGGDSFANGLITACLLYCIGTFSIVGPIMSALQGDNTFLFTNSTLDLVSSTIFATTYGFGMILAAPVLFCWQGAIWLIAKLASTSPLLQGTLVNEMAAVGGILILASGLSILKLKDIKTLNYIPALFIPVIWFLIKSLF